MPITVQRAAPAAALRLRGGPLQLAEGQGDGKTTPIKMLARTGDAIEHWWYGRLVHDLSGMTPHRDKIAIDYCHNETQMLGYLDTFDVSSGDLVVSGELVHYGDADLASEIVHKNRAGVPYEASIDFTGGGLRFEELTAGATAEVNGRTIEGPAVIVREWTLRAVAICPYGADKNTKTELAGAAPAAIEIIREGDSMPTKLSTAINNRIDALANEHKTRGAFLKQLAAAGGCGLATVQQLVGGDAVAAAPSEKQIAAFARVLECKPALLSEAAAADAQEASAENSGEGAEGSSGQGAEGGSQTEEADDAAAANSETDGGGDGAAKGDGSQAGGSEQPPAQQSDLRAEAKRFITAFGGEHGGQWFAEGLTFAQAQEKHAARLTEENKRLRAKLAATEQSDPDGASFEGGDGKQSSGAASRFNGKMSPTLARFAAGLGLKN